MGLGVRRHLLRRRSTLDLLQRIGEGLSGVDEAETVSFARITPATSIRHTPTNC